MITTPLPLPPQPPPTPSPNLTPQQLYMPPACPKIGNIDLTGPWTGGKPVDADWNDTENEAPFSVYCYRTG